MTFSMEIDFQSLQCATCGLAFAVTTDFQSRRRADHGEFYCPAGHINLYSGQSDVEKERKARVEAENRLQATINQERHARLVAEKARDKEKRAKRALERRVAHGVCPCCNKTFASLSHHMTTDHPEFRLPEGKRQKLIAAGSS